MYSHESKELEGQLFLLSIFEKNLYVALQLRGSGSNRRWHGAHFGTADHHEVRDAESWVHKLREDPKAECSLEEIWRGKGPGSRGPDLVDFAAMTTSEKPKLGFGFSWILVDKAVALRKDGYYDQGHVKIGWAKVCWAFLNMVCRGKDLCGTPKAGLALCLLFSE